MSEEYEDRGDDRPSRIGWFIGGSAVGAFVLWWATRKGGSISGQVNTVALSFRLLPDGSLQSATDVVSRDIAIARVLATGGRDVVLVTPGDVAQHWIADTRSAFTARGVHVQLQG